MTTVLITGANKGLGRETATTLAGLGWTVLLGARDEELGRSASAEIEGDVRFVKIDVSSQESVDAAAAYVTETVGSLDVLINNAGIIGERVTVLETKARDFLACYGVNVLGPVRTTLAFLPLLEKSELPRIVNVSSGLGSLSAVNNPERVEFGVSSLVYPSSKSALNMITTQYAKALPGWKINAVDPGYTATDLNGHSGTQTIAEGARVIITYAQVGADGPTGGFFDNDGPVAE